MQNANTTFDAVPLHDQDDRKSLSWSDIAETATILPQLEVEALSLIEHTLGYLPHRSVTLPYEISLRGLVSSYRYGMISASEFSQQAEGYVKLVRNEDLIPHSHIDYDPSVYDHYWQSFEPYGHLTSERIQMIAGADCDLRHIVTAEIWLRDFIALDTRPRSQKLTSSEIRALTIIRYRQVLLTKGKQAADVSAIPFQQLPRQSELD